MLCSLMLQRDSGETALWTLPSSEYVNYGTYFALALISFCLSQTSPNGQ